MSFYSYSVVAQLCAAVLLVFPAVSPGGEELPSDALTQRVTAYWEALTLSDIPTAWSLEESRQSGESNPFLYYQHYARQYPVIEASIEDIRRGGEVAEIDVRVLYALPIANRSILKSKVIKDRWRLVEGDWLHLAPSSHSESHDKSRGDPASAAPD